MSRPGEVDDDNVCAEDEDEVEAEDEDEVEAEDEDEVEAEDEDGGPEGGLKPIPSAPSTMARLRSARLRRVLSILWLVPPLRLLLLR